MKNEITLINPKEFGIEEKKANELYGNLPQLIKERSELEKQFNEVIKLDIESKDTWKQARDLRLLIQKNRTQGINVWHKNAKDFFLKGGQFVDAIKRKEVAVNERMENDLEQIEKYEQILEQKRLSALQIERVEKLSPYVEDASERNLSGMEDDVWNAYFQAKKKEYEDRMEAEKKAELERIEKEKAEAEERERIKKENERLKKEAELKEKRNTELRPYIIFIRDYDKMLNMSESDYKKELLDIKKAAEQHWEYERKEKIRKEKEEKVIQEKHRKEREAFEAKLKAEREEKERIESQERARREKLEAELRAKEEAERKEKEAEKAKIQAELNKGDADKVNDLINDLKNLKIKYSFKSEKNRKMYQDIGILIDKVISYIEK